MVKNRRALIVAALLVGVLVWLVFFRGGAAPVAGSAPAAGSRGGSRAAEVVPWIHLDRLKAENPAVSLGRRNIFSYGPVTPPPTPEPEATEEPEPTVPVPYTPSPTPPPPPIMLKFMGVVKAENGPRIAVLINEQKEILHGREGDVLAGRYKIVKIMLESVEVEEVGSGQKQTIRIGGR